MAERFDKNWDDLARGIGYRNRRDMLEDMYLGQELSLTDIGSRLGCSSHCVMHQLDKLDIARRPRGGNNNTAQQTRKLFRLDQRVIVLQDINVVAKHTGVSSSLVYKYRRAVKENKPWNSVYSPRPTNSSSMQPSVEPI